MQPAKDAIEAVLVNNVANNGRVKSTKYAMCSANGWMTAGNKKKIKNKINNHPSHSETLLLLLFG